MQNILENASNDLAVASEKLHSMHGLKLILCERRFTKAEAKEDKTKVPHSFKRYSPLVEISGPQTPENAIKCTVEEGFYILGPDESAVFVSPDGKGGM